MLIAWVICSTIGIFVARYLKPYTKEKKLMGKQAWFPVKKNFLIILILKMNNSFTCLLYTSPSPRDGLLSRMPSSA